MSSGTKNRLAFATEAVFGTPPAAPLKSWGFRGDKLVPGMDSVNDEDTQIGVQEEGSESIVTKRWVEGPIEYDANMDMLPFWLKHVLGTLATTGASPTYTHTLTNNQGEKPSLAAYWEGPLTPAGKLEAAGGLKLRKLDLASSVGNKVTCTPDFYGKGAETDTGYSEIAATMPGINTDPSLASTHVSSCTIGGVEVKSILKSWRLTLEPRMTPDEDFGHGSEFLQTLECHGLGISGDLELDLDATTKPLIVNVLKQTAAPIVLVLTRGAHSATISLFKPFYTNAAVVGRKGKLKKPLSFKGYYSHADAKAIQAVIVNGTAAY